jgi:ABC-type lipopolysaccharide export system ATPase subunit
MDEAVTLCDRVYILVNGEIVLHGSVAELIARRGSLEQAYLGAVDHAD